MKEQYKVNPKTGCWEWRGRNNSAGKKGYGILPGSKKKVYAHRHFYEKYRGKIPVGMFVCHHCDNPPCVNPEHLFLGDGFDNMRDASLKGRLEGRYTSRGSDHGMAILTEEKVVAIRQEYDTSDTSYRKLGKKYSVDFTTVGKIIKRKLWGWL